MNPFEMIQSLIMGSQPAASPEGAGRFAQPNLMPQPGNEAALVPERAPLFESGGDNSPAMMLRRLLTGSNEPPIASPPPQPAASPPPRQASSPPANPPGVSLGSMPAPSSSPDLLEMFAQQSGGRQMQTSSSPPPGRAMPSAPPAGSMPRGQPQPAAAGPSPAASPSAPAGGNGFADFLSGLQKNPTAIALRDILGSAMAGASMAHGTPRGGNIGAFGAGYTTAQKASDARAQTEIARQQKAFEQALALRKDTRDERGANRSDEELGIKRGDLSLRERDLSRKEQETKVKNQVSVEKLMKVRDDGTVPLAAKIKIQDQLNQYADKVNKNGLMSQAELDTALTKERTRLEEYYGMRKPPGQSGSAAPVTQQARGPDGKVVTLELQNGQWVPKP